MPLLDLTLPVAEGSPLPAEIKRFLRDVDTRIGRFQVACRIPGFVPSNYAAAYRVLQALSDSSLMRGRRFCEWGSGFGVVTSMAAMLDFEACGIEIEGMLVTEARQLAEDYGIGAEFATGSFVPRGAEDRVHKTGEYAWMTTEGDYAYEELDLELEDVDVIFAYPWPDEEEVTGKLFDTYAGTGAILVTHHSGEDFRFRRKVAGAKRKRRK